MRNVISLNEGWCFRKGASVKERGGECETVNLPHTWNADDGQDGGNDYYRGRCLYTKKLTRGMLPSAERYYLEINGANSSADVCIDGVHLAHHDGGYSTWRVDITDSISDDAELEIEVDNSPSDTVYPQMADFTFYGGLYRDVRLIAVESTHFDLEDHGGCGVWVTPRVVGDDAKIDIRTDVIGLKDGDMLSYRILDSSGKTVEQRLSDNTSAEMVISGVRLWKARHDPYLYTLECEIVRDGRPLDRVCVRFGCRTIEVDPERGFILNGEEYPLRGVSRHQDRLGVGNALLPEHHKEDIALIMEVGATTVRLAHYQHDQYFYDLCDENGLIVWAEIPYISKHMNGGYDNTVSQMTELVTQNYNHPSIVVWGLSNEITINGSDPELIENHRRLNDLAHSLDPTRYTAVAAVSMTDINDEYLRIPDLVSYNHYFGWYGGDVSMNGPWFDRFHSEHPSIPIGCSEYGCEALNWHSSRPAQGDYTEEYQAYYHEELIKQLFSRKYLWATHVWNMFDFGADARAEGGENGQNHKGLVTMDRKYKKDAFYIYKANLSREPFVHICSKRYVDRVEDKVTVKVYSNLPQVELTVNGSSHGSKSSSDCIFLFEIDNVGESHITAKSGEYIDSAVIRKVERPNEDYVLKEQGAVLNWFDIEASDTHFTLNDKLSDIINTDKGKLWFANFGLKLKNMMSVNKDGAAGFDIPEDKMMLMMTSFTVLRLCTMLGMTGISFSKEELLKINEELNKIEK